MGNVCDAYGRALSVQRAGWRGAWEGRPGLCQQGAGHVVFDGSVPYKLCTAYKDSPAVEKAIAEMTWVRSVYWYSVPTVPVFRKCDAIRYSKMFCY